MSDGAWLSEDQGATFAPVNDGLFMGARVRAIAGDGQVLYAMVEGTEMNPLSAAVTLFSKIGSAPWTKLAASGINLDPGGPLRNILSQGSELWAIDGARLYVSDDRGASFRTVAQGA